MIFKFKNIDLFLSCLVVFVFAISCNKKIENIQKDSLTSEQICEQLSEDPLFSEYVSGIHSLLDKSKNQTDILSDNQFQTYFKNAVVNSDLESKKIIAKAMGYEFYEVYWNERESMNNAIKNLSSKYELRKLDENQWKRIIKNKILIMDNSNRITNVSMSYGVGPNCAAKYWNCMEQAAATYAVEQVACVMFAGLGWTGVGVVGFVGCEAGSRWHLNTLKKGCEIDFRICSEK